MHKILPIKKAKSEAISRLSAFTAISPTHKKTKQLKQKKLYKKSTRKKQPFAWILLLN